MPRDNTVAASVVSLWLIRQTFPTQRSNSVQRKMEPLQSSVVHCVAHHWGHLQQPAAMVNEVGSSSWMEGMHRVLEDTNLIKRDGLHQEDDTTWGSLQCSHALWGALLPHTVNHVLVQDSEGRDGFVGLHASGSPVVQHLSIWLILGTWAFEHLPQVGSGGCTGWTSVRPFHGFG